MIKIYLNNQVEAYEAPTLYAIEAQVEAGYGESLVWDQESEF